MKFSLSWLKTHLDTDAPISVIAETLSSIGLEVEAIEDRAAGLAPFKIVRVIEAVQHPNADRLRVCRVQTDQGEVGVVCGAPNARTGMMAVFAPPGSVVPGSGMVLKIGEIRGVASAGMLVSERELGLGEDHDGIIDLPADAPLGMSYAHWAGLDDPIIEIGVTPNRGDGFSVRGVARDLAAAGLGTLRPWSPAPVLGVGESLVAWRNEFPDACPLVVGRTVRGVKNGESPDWLKRRLTAIGLRPISALVDITNFFTIDLGRPLHVFDAGKVTGGVLTLRRSAGERFAGLNGKDVFAGADDCVIADAQGAQSLAGIVGGEATSCDAATTDVFIECALFDRVRIALTGQRSGIHSDARQRFERGIDPSILPQALDAATAMIMALCGGQPSEMVAAGAEPTWQRDATLRFDRLGSFGGHPVSTDRAVSILQDLGFVVRAQDADQVTVGVPPWRNDVAVTRSNYTYDPAIYAVNGPVSLLDPAPELAAERAQRAAAGAAAVAAEVDLLEEVLRIDGLDRVVPVSLPAMSAVPQPTLTARQTRTMRARRVLAARGLDECVTFSFVAQATAAQFGAVPERLRLANPIAADLDQMRPTPLATLALAAQTNAARGMTDVALFEVGPGFVDATPSGQNLIAAGLRLGATPLSWLDGDRALDVWDAKGDLFAVLAELGVPLDSLSVTAEAPRHYHPGQSGTVRQGPRVVLGYFGTLHPSIATAFDLPMRSIGFELMLDAIADPKRRRKAAPDLSPLQPVRRDFAFVVDAVVPAETVIRAVRGAERTLITEVRLFDRYEGEHVPSGKVSLAVAVTLQPREKSLTDAEIETVAGKITAAVAKTTGGVLRGER
ncbi:MAG TPA: phenylalanine--tRNA ligase subunit beta [Acidiphilium sp.]|nr:MAG: phenylalanine--tRNA ligase subunit beta [Acidiphilium sp. 21-60-14]OYV91824.1 MAG: phenylalanine--tRNA ligase subunit beta [Acidiphilium sp. 37-60-79]OZB41274.1 MAG: phenylalanine--tRNA ligase subunit beta [Acidiphilium sp. 34-60-192]HQT88075.1 phenylalanine--tRNA ligase subunit beta [Acidiphilium sp.]HQU23009.1 phenylalanine--tRNA ligase subunit beta [Acidiphilium sp.]